jgi:hypothetical protein
MLLEIDPERSKRLISQGYEDAMEQLSDYDPQRQAKVPA